MTRMLAIEWAEYGINVNAVAPGRLDTASPSRAGTGTNKDYMEAMLKRIPLHRLATAEEVAAAAVFLAGPGAASITGQTIVIDGGLTAAFSAFSNIEKACRLLQAFRQQHRPDMAITRRSSSLSC